MSLRRARERDKASRPLLLTNIGQLLTLRSAKAGPRRGLELGELGIITDAAVLCAGGKIVSLGKRSDAKRDAYLRQNWQRVTEIDCGGGVVLPGFVDSHTHPVFAGPRLVDFEKRISGASYEEIAAAGGGIRSSVAGVRRASRNALADQVRSALSRMLAHGTTTIEAKSGYGLSRESELKSLQAVADAAASFAGTVVPTLLGAHVVPKECEDPEEYVEIVCREMIPEAAKKKLARFVDVFLEQGAFRLEETRRIFVAAQRFQLGVRAHVCQLTASEIAPILVFEPASLDHLDRISDSDIQRLSQCDTVATLLPGSNYFLGMNAYPPARPLIEGGAAVALATDYNPGTSPTLSMPMVLSVACTHMRMSPAESIAAATINGAYALELADRKGSIEPGKDADLATFAVKDHREIPYWYGENLCSFTVANGAYCSSAHVNSSSRN